LGRDARRNEEFEDDHEKVQINWLKYIFENLLRYVHLARFYVFFYFERKFAGKWCGGGCELVVVRLIVPTLKVSSSTPAHISREYPPVQINAAKNKNKTPVQPVL